MYLVRPQSELAQHRAIRHPVVALRIVGRDASFVAPEKLHFLPVDAEVKSGRKQVIGAGGRRTARETERELAVSADCLACYMGGFFGGADVEVLLVVQNNQFRFRHSATSRSPRRFRGEVSRAPRLYRVRPDARESRAC